MKRNLIFVIFLLLLSIVACTSGTSQLQTPESVKITPAIPIPSSEAWEKEWQTVVAAAKKEGRVAVVAVGFGTEFRNSVVPAFQNKFGIEVELTIGRGAEISQKLFSERRAGLYLVDVYIGGNSTILNDLKPNGVLEPLEPTLILPDVKDPKLWWEGVFPWVDLDHLIAYALAFPNPPIAINTDLVKPDEIKSYNDLLNPKWKGKIVLDNPAMSGPGIKWFGMVGEKIMGMDYIRSLAKQEPVISNDWRQQVEWLARGKNPIIIAYASAVVAEFKEAGAPIFEIIPKEGTYVTPGGSGITYVNRAPHPNAARVLINFYLSKEGLTLFSRGSMRQSSRIDVPTDFLVSRRDPNLKYYFSDTEELLLKNPERMKLAKEIFGLK